MTAKSRRSQADDESLMEPLTERAESLRRQAIDLEANLRQSIQDNPVVCLCGAIAAGYLVGRIIARR